MIERDVSRIVIHCSASPDGRWNTAEDINQWHLDRGFHRSQRPWCEQFNPHLTAIGYHYIIGTNGALWAGRHLEEVGAHAVNFNQRSVGICMVGTRRFTAEQWEQLSRLLATMPWALHGAPLSRDLAVARAWMAEQRIAVCGHRDLPNVAKECPGFDVASWLAAGEPSPEHVLPNEECHGAV